MPDDIYTIGEQNGGRGEDTIEVQNGGRGEEGLGQKLEIPGGKNL